MRWVKCGPDLDTLFGVEVFVELDAYTPMAHPYPSVFARLLRDFLGLLLIFPFFSLMRVCVALATNMPFAALSWPIFNFPFFFLMRVCVALATNMPFAALSWPIFNFPFFS